MSKKQSLSNNSDFIDRPIHRHRASSSRYDELTQRIIATVTNGLAVKVKPSDGRSMEETQRLFVGTIGRRIRIAGYRLRTARLQDNSGYALWAEAPVVK